MTKSSFKFFACIIFFAFLSVISGGCGGSSSNSPDEPALEDVFNKNATVTVCFTFFGKESSATFRQENDKYLLVEKGGNFSDEFDKAEAWSEDKNFVVQIYLENGWELGVASTTNNANIAAKGELPTDDVWEIIFAADVDTYQDRVRTGVFATASEDFQVSSIVVNNVDIIDTLEPLPYEEPTEDQESDSPTDQEESFDDENSNDSGTGGSSGGSGGGSSPSPSIITVSSIALNSTDISIDVGKTATLVATVMPPNATNKTVTWSSSSADIVSVDQSGKVTAVSAGTATITVKSNADSTKTVSCVVTVKPVFKVIGNAMETPSSLPSNFTEVTLEEATTYGQSFTGTVAWLIIYAKDGNNYKFVRYSPEMNPRNLNGTQTWDNIVRGESGIYHDPNQVSIIAPTTGNSD